MSATRKSQRRKNNIAAHASISHLIIGDMLILVRVKCGHNALLNAHALRVVDPLLSQLLPKGDLCLLERRFERLFPLAVGSC